MVVKMGSASCLLFAASSYATASDVQVIFDCRADNPTPIYVIASKVDDTYALTQFEHPQLKLDIGSTADSVNKSSYHRALVSEHSMHFSYDESKVVISDYHSEELGKLTQAYSVTFTQDDNKQYWLCNDKSKSTLPAIEDFD
tara:strand:- start:101 stop:526 length:426 start_codon:yes stop_codon:yes gene_type:complete